MAEAYWDLEAFGACSLAAEARPASILEHNCGTEQTLNHSVRGSQRPGQGREADGDLQGLQHSEQEDAHQVLCARQGSWSVSHTVRSQQPCGVGTLVIPCYR